MRLYVIILFFCFLYSKNVAQLYIQPIDSLGIKEGAVFKNYPLAGGLNAPQFNAINLNGDSRNDLIVFDRVGNVILTFINTSTTIGSTQYSYQPQWRRFFPPLHDWVKVVDFNCDGIEDIFTSAGDSVKVFKGLGIGNNPAFVLENPTLQFDDGTGILQSIFVKDVDLPDVYDADQDGDMDFFTWDVSGSYVQYFQNTSVEDGNACNALDFTLQANCWGDIIEPVITNWCTLNAGCRLSPKEMDGAHPGSTTLVWDYNADTLPDLLVGDIAFQNMNLLTNGGSLISPLITAQDTTYPNYNQSILCYNFPAAFHIDVNNDNKKDIIISPNSGTTNMNYDAAQLYLNVSSNDTVALQFQNSKFLLNEMIDLGEGAYPAFFDYNNDGLMDMVLGNFNYFTIPGSNNKGQLCLLKNIGTSSNPVFEIKDRNWQNFTSYSTPGANKQNFIPTFGDIDNDGDKDMLVGEYNGTLYYFINNGYNSITDDVNFSFVTAAYMGIDVGQCAAPQWVDVDRDGLLDLIIGERNGNLNFFRNTGTSSTPSYSSTPDYPLWGGVVVNAPGDVTGYSVPHLGIIDSSSNEYALLVGSEKGKIFYFTNIEGNIGGNFTLTNILDSIKVGEKTAAAIYDLDNDGAMELLVGNYRGGLSAFKVTGSLQIEPDIWDSSIEVFPNPGQSSINIQTQHNIDKIQIFDVTGKLLINEPTNLKTLNTEQLTKGLYIIKISIYNKIFCAKWIKS